VQVARSIVSHLVSRVDQPCLREYVGRRSSRDADGCPDPLEACHVSYSVCDDTGVSSVYATHVVGVPSDDPVQEALVVEDALGCLVV
jgi:hypothetical protein